jgi:serine protease AprX
VVKLRLLVFRCAVLAIALALLSRDGNAQLALPSLSPLLQPVSSLFCSPSQLATSPKLDGAVRAWVRAPSSEPLRVIVSSNPSLLVGTLRQLVSDLGGIVLGELPDVNAIVAQVDHDALVSLTCDVSVQSISMDATVVASEDLSSAQEYSLRASLGLPAASPRGSGVGVAVIDSGISSSADVSRRVTAFVDFTRGTLSTAPSDGYGHGTHVAGLIAEGALDPSVAAYRGVAPDVRLIGLKVLDSAGRGRTSDVIRALEYATKHRKTLGIDVINLSLGHPVYEPAKRDPLVKAVEKAVKAGIVVVVAAGNHGTNAARGQVGFAGITSPGNAPSVITVGALDTKGTTSRADDDVAPYSSRGPTWYDGTAKPDLVAPGHRLVSSAAPESTLYQTYSASQVGTSYLRLSGTSMATAVTTGTVALMIEAARQAHPNAPALTPNTIKAALEYSALVLGGGTGGPIDVLAEGAGALNADGAVRLVRAIDTTRGQGE